MKDSVAAPYSIPDFKSLRIRLKFTFSTNFKSYFELLPVQKGQNQPDIG